MIDFVVLDLFLQLVVTLEKSVVEFCESSNQQKACGHAYEI